MNRFKSLFDRILTGQRYISTAGIFVLSLALSVFMGEVVHQRWAIVFVAVHVFLVISVFFFGLIILSYLRLKERRRGIKQMLSWIASVVMAMNVAALFNRPDAEYQQFLVGLGGAIVVIIIFAYIARHHPRDSFTMFLFGRPEAYKNNKDVTKH